MNGRQRINSILDFRLPDRFPLPPWVYWRETVVRWQSEGLAPGQSPEELTGAGESDFYYLPVNFGLQPEFPVEVLELDDRYAVVRDELGITKRMRRCDYDITGGRFDAAADTGSMCKWLRHPVTSLEDWEEIYHTRLAVDFANRLQGEAVDNLAIIKERSTERFTLAANFPLLGGLGAVRELMGFENMVYAMADKPELIKRIMDDLCAFWIGLFQSLFDNGVRVDGVVFFEDMCATRGPLISPAMFEAFFGGAYRRINHFLHENGVRWREIDSDGNVLPMVATWRDCGITVVSPCQARCGFTLPQLREAFADMVFKGGIDKETLAADPAAIQAEVWEKLRFAWQVPGYLPLLDHSVPPHVSLENYLCYAKEYKRVGARSPV